MGRDGARTPMPWIASESHAGFTTGEPWLPLDPSHFPRAVDQQSGDPDSVLSFFQRALRYRQSNSAMLTGDLVFLPSPRDCLLFLRSDNNQSVLCGFNLSAGTHMFDLARPLKVDLTAGKPPVVSGDTQMVVAGWSGFVGACSPRATSSGVAGR